MVDEAILKSCLPSRLAQYASHFLAGQYAFGVSATLLAAICDRESSGGQSLTPPKPSGTGDSGHGRGLMQIDDRSHSGFLTGKFPDGSPLWANAAFNIHYGAWLLGHYYQRAGSWPVAIAAYNAGLAKALEAKNPNDVTTGRNYVSDVLHRQASFEALISKA